MRLMEACLTVLEMEEAREQPSAIEQVYMPVVPALFRIPDALARIRATLAGMDAPVNLTGCGNLSGSCLAGRFLR